MQVTSTVEVPPDSGNITRSEEDTSDQTHTACKLIICGYDIGIVYIGIGIGIAKIELWTEIPARNWNV